MLTAWDCAPSASRLYVAKGIVKVLQIEAPGEFRVLTVAEPKHPRCPLIRLPDEDSIVRVVRLDAELENGEGDEGLVEFGTDTPVAPAE